MTDQYRDLMRFSKYIGITPESLVKAYEIETEFHRKIISEKSREERLKLYSEVYNKVHSIYNNGMFAPQNTLTKPPKARKARLFRKEVLNNSLLEIGCGQGAFLMALANSGIAKDLLGMDVTIPDDKVVDSFPSIEFIKTDITKFDVTRKLDVIYANHVFEHIAPADMITHLTSIHAALNHEGTLIVNVPNRLFGPHDVTRIVDFSNTNQVPALGTHLNETTYSEIIEVLKSYGFSKFRTTFPNVFLRHLIPDFRMSPSFMCWLEHSPRIVSLLHQLKFRGKCIANLEVSIICTKSRDMVAAHE